MRRFHVIGFMFRLLLLVSMFAPLSLTAQKQKPMNYKKFDTRLFHFGVTFGGNVSDFYMYPAPDAFSKYGYTSIINESAPGGQIGILSSMKLGTPMLRLRFMPSLTFQERVLYYYTPTKDPKKTTDDVDEERINSTNLDFPLLLQFRTLRHNNFTSYIVGGAQWTLDMQSSEDANQSLIDPFVKIKKHDTQLVGGVGVEFFAVYFKFAMEIRYCHGLNNVLIKDYTPISNPLDQLKNRVWSFSIILEG